MNNRFQQMWAEIKNMWNHALAHDVSGRIASIIDLPAADALYHQSCSVNFRTKRQIPKAFQSDVSPCKIQKSPGRPEAIDTNEAFKIVISYIEENEGSVLTMNELINLMEETCGERTYSYKHMKSKLLNHFGDSISVSSFGNTETKVTLKRKASEIIHEFSNNIQGLSETDQMKAVVTAAAKMIKADINSIQDDKKFYPTFQSITSKTYNATVVTSLKDDVKQQLMDIIKLCGRKGTCI